MPHRPGHTVLGEEFEQIFPGQKSGRIRENVLAKPEPVPPGYPPLGIDGQIGVPTSTGEPQDPGLEIRPINIPPAIAPPSSPAAEESKFRRAVAAIRAGTFTIADLDDFFDAAGNLTPRGQQLLEEYKRWLLEQQEAALGREEKLRSEREFGLRDVQQAQAQRQAQMQQAMAERQFAFQQEQARIANALQQQELFVRIIPALLQNPFAFAALQSLGGLGGLGAGQGAFALPGGTGQGGGLGAFANTPIAPFAQELGGLGFNPLGQGQAGLFPGGTPSLGQLGALSPGAQSLLGSYLGFRGILPSTLQRESARLTPLAGSPIRPSIRFARRG